MAKALSQKTIKLQRKHDVVGKSVIDVITSGMYSNPLMVLREYIQNSVDSLDAAILLGMLRPQDAKVYIDVDGAERRIEIEDNGLGVKPADVEKTLCYVGFSTKEINTARGFRGIGRLGGAGYCALLRFETKHSSRSTVTEVTWDCLRMRSLLSDSISDLSAAQLITKCVTINTRRSNKDDPDQFFRVTMIDVERFHQDNLMNPYNIRRYLSQICPVPYDKERFSFADKIDLHLSSVDGYRGYKIVLNGSQIYRPHRDLIDPDLEGSDIIHNVTCFSIEATPGTEIPRGWFAETECLSSFAPRVLMRGIRVRQGNIQIGDEYFFADKYAERRFATWHIGEIHVNYIVKANARRDGFEQSQYYETILEYFSAIGLHLSNQCRMSSKRRSAISKAKRILASCGGSPLPQFVVDSNHYAQARTRAKSLVTQLGFVEELLKPSQKQALNYARRTLDGESNGLPYLYDALDGRRLRHTDPKELMEDVAKAILEYYSESVNAEDLLHKVFSEYVKPTSL